MIEGEVMKEAGVRSAGTTSATGIKERRHKPTRRPPGGVYVAPVPLTSRIGMRRFHGISGIGTLGINLSNANRREKR
jgi:hypothetical protein